MKQINKHSKLKKLGSNTVIEQDKQVLYNWKRMGGNLVASELNILM